jgi:hypothetical protein
VLACGNYQPAAALDKTLYCRGKLVADAPCVVDDYGLVRIKLGRVGRASGLNNKLILAVVSCKQRLLDKEALPSTS